MGSRIKWIQVAKGIGIILVVSGHTITTSLRNSSAIAMKMYEYIYFFHMAFFFYLSGRTYLLSKKKDYLIIDHLKKNSVRLLVPYLSYAIVVYLIFMIINTIPGTANMARGAGYGSQSLKEWLFGLLSGSIKFSAHLWFVYALFVMRTFTDLVERIFYKKWMTICFIISIFLLALSQLLYNPNLEILNRILLLYVWFMAGIIKDYSFVSLPRAILCCIIGNVYWLLRYFIIPGTSDISHTLLVRYSDQAVKVFLLIFIVRLSYSISKKKSRILEYLGNQSFHIYLLHQPFFCSVVSVLLFNNTVLPAPLIILITFVTALVGSLLVIKIANIKRIKKYSGVLLGNR